MSTSWPALPYEEWKDTYATLHMWMQVAGKVALAQAPPVNHSWAIAMHLTPRGLSTHLLPHGTRSFAIEFDFVAHQLSESTDEATQQRRGGLVLQLALIGKFGGRGSCHVR